MLLLNQIKNFNTKSIRCQSFRISMLGANNLSGFVAHKLSGYNGSQKGGFHEAGTSTTGDSENGI